HPPCDPPALPSFPTRRSSDLVVCVDSVGRAGVNRQPVTPHDHHGVHAAAAGECLDHIPDCRHTAAKLGMETSEVKQPPWVDPLGDRKSTRLNSSHVSISYAVF